ncbi:hypothetical protein EXE25_13120 [Acinetobacter bouvetii]|uniref:Uncharacterized protein n=1 Tax=Acinetobacter bouvetii TaxID=202951 RepID=A0A4Q7AQK3_9GAMM|nr:hypothetical protein [Acinetobacter bouvetii]RZG65491.1 hypothetical protein EXE25_13120 [Acinetobacter bouvetii]
MMMIEASTQQNSKSAVLFEALIQRNNEKIMVLVGQNVRAALFQNTDALNHVYGILPDYFLNQAEIIAVAQIDEKAVGEITKIDYAYMYPEETVLFSVVYQGHEGGDEVVGLWLDVQHSTAI